MRRRLLGTLFASLLLSACGGAARGPITADAPSPTTEAPRILVPGRIGAFRLVDRHEFPDAAQGTQYRYRSADSTVIDVYVYPGVDLGEECDLRCAERTIAEEMDLFEVGMPEMISRGYVDTIWVKSRSTDTPPAGAAWRLGRSVRLNVRRDGEYQRSELHLRYLPQTRIKVRATWVETESRTANIERFVRDVVTRLTTELPMGPALPAPSVDSTFSLVTGTWDWITSEPVCGRATHTLLVAADRQSFTLTFSDGRTPAVLTYRVLAAGERVLAGSPHALRTKLDGETRKTEAGDVAKWDLILLSRDRYAWRRTDWDSHGLTQSIVRCANGTPLADPG